MMEMVWGALGIAVLPMLGLVLGLIARLQRTKPRA
jgi:hypothetical protein